MSKTSRLFVALICVAMPVLAEAEVLEVLVAKQREAMAAEIDKKIYDARGGSRAMQSAPVTTELPSKRPEREELHVTGIYGANGSTTVDVAFGDGPSLPLPVAKNRSINNWSVQKVSPSVVTFKNVKTGEVRPVNLAAPTMGGVGAPAQVVAGGPGVASLPVQAQPSLTMPVGAGRVGAQ